MKIQVCRKCGNRNTVISGPLSACNYCGSDDLEPISDANTPPGMASSAVEGSSGKAKWFILLLVLLIMIGVALWYFMFSPNAISAVSNNVTKSFGLNPSSSNLAVLPQQVMKDSERDQVGSDLSSLDKTNVAEGIVSNETSKQSTQEISSLAQTKNIQQADGSIKVETYKIVNGQLEPVNNNKTAVVQEQDIDVSKPAVNDTPKDLTEQPMNVTKAVAEPNTKTLEKKAPPAPVVKKTVTQPAEKKVISKPAPKTVTKPQLSEDEKTIAELKQKLEDYKKQTAAKAEQKLSTETRLSMRVLDRQKGLVTDAQTGLMWMACTIGQNWTGGSCAGNAEEVLWAEAASIAEESSYGGYNDWRLPTREELNSIVYCSNGRMAYGLGNEGKMAVKNGVPQNGKCLGNFIKPTIDSNVFPNTVGSTYWSYSRNAKATYNAWAVFFNGGYQFNYNTTNLAYVRLVRRSR